MMTRETKEQHVELTVDGLKTQARLHEPLIDVASRLGLEIPSLCHHEALEPLGACRLCLVQVAVNGRKKLVTSCNYPAQADIVVFTATEEVLRHRQMVVKMLLARCPEVPAIQALATSMGVGDTQFPATDETCILCGLCTRVCDTYATSAIARMHRGEKKTVGTPADDPPEACIGCGACAKICPTGHIKSTRTPGQLSIWDRTFPQAICTVNPLRCIACGVCETACPFSVARVVLQQDGRSRAVIDPKACRGCGVCSAACPCGAIDQPRVAPAQLPPIPVEDTGRVLAVACPRSALKAPTSPRLPHGVDILELPCAGGIRPAVLLGALARGYAGVLVLGRHEPTCGLAGAEAHARQVVERVEQVARAVGLGPGRVAFAEPAPGREGPVSSIRAFQQKITQQQPTVLVHRLPQDVPMAMPGDAATIAGWLLEQEALAAHRDTTWGDPHFDVGVPFLPTYRTTASQKYASFRQSKTSDKTDTPAVGERRITSHPILTPPASDPISFTFEGETLPAQKGEMIASALFAAGISVFGHHHRDGGAQGIFCANGQCSQCSVMANGRMVKSCMVPVEPGMTVERCDGLPPLPPASGPEKMGFPKEISVPVLVLGGGPAGLSAAIELGRVGIEVLVVDDKPELGGKLTLQTHGFFGSAADCYAGIRGIDIGRNLADDVAALPSVRVWTRATALGLFGDGKVGISTPQGYRLVTPETLIVALGAREKALSFPGCDLPGIYGAGAFQTLVNRDLISTSKKLFVLGGGNVGLIGAYHALQAGIDVVGLVEALPECGGYKVHADKIKRLGVPIWTRHSVIKASGNGRLERVTIAEIDETGRPISGTEQTFEADTLLIAVGLAPVDEILTKAREYGLNVVAAGDSDEVAEASAAIFSGRMVGRRLARDRGVPIDIPEHWESLAAVLRSRPGKTTAWRVPKGGEPIFPVIRCVQEIPCDPCVAACPHGLISMPGGIMGLPEYSGGCLGCGSCVVRCPGLAIVLVAEDYDKEKNLALVSLPVEFGNEKINLGTDVLTTDIDGLPLGKGQLVAVREREDQDRRKLALVAVPFEDRLNVAGFSIRGPSVPLATEKLDDDEDPIVCRCERIRKSEIVREIRAGVRDLNQLKSLARPSMGGCGGKTCTALVQRIFREEGVLPKEVTPGTIRPLIAETPLYAFIQTEDRDDDII